MFTSGVFSKGKRDLTGLLAEYLQNEAPETIGAVVAFLGVARGTGKNGKVVSSVEMQSYNVHANKVIKKICREIENKYGVTKVGIYHLLGKFDVKDPIVLVMVASSTRRGIFDALKEAVERYKIEPALFKREFYDDGTYNWIESG